MSNELTVIDGNFRIIESDATLNDAGIVELFLRLKDNKSGRTKEGYAASIKMMRSFMNCGLKDVTLTKALNYKQWLETETITKKDGTVEKRFDSLHSIKLHINVAKSLYSFMISINAASTNPFAAIPVDAPKELSVERILSEYDVQRLIHADVKLRDSMIVKMLYVAGLRASELCALLWEDLSSSCVLHIKSGKGDKERWVTLPSELCRQLQELRNGASNEAPMFVSQKGGNLDESALHRIIKGVAAKAGIEKSEEVSAHWLRHAHASHALDRGSDIVTLRDTLGHASIATTNKYLHSKPGKSSALSLSF